MHVECSEQKEPPSQIHYFCFDRFLRRHKSVLDHYNPFLRNQRPQKASGTATIIMSNIGELQENAQEEYSNVSSLEALLARYELHVDSLRGQVVSTNGQIDILNERVKSEQMEIWSKQGKIDLLKRKVEYTKMKIECDNGEIQSETRQIEHKTEKIESEKRQIESKKGYLDSLKGLVEFKKGQIDALKRQIGVVKGLVVPSATVEMASNTTNNMAAASAPTNDMAAEPDLRTVMDIIEITESLQKPAAATPSRAASTGDNEVADADLTAIAE